MEMQPDFNPSQIKLRKKPSLTTRDMCQCAPNTGRQPVVSLCCPLLQEEDGGFCLLVQMSASSEAITKADADVDAAAAAVKLAQAQAKKKLKVEAAAAAEKKRLAELAAKWKEPGPLKLPNLPGMKVYQIRRLVGTAVTPARADDIRHEQSALAAAHQGRACLRDIPRSLHRCRANAAGITG
jgi:hypothetical protein